jgi:hypothetical protein
MSRWQFELEIAAMILPRVRSQTAGHCWPRKSAVVVSRALTFVFFAARVLCLAQVDTQGAKAVPVPPQAVAPKPGAEAPSFTFKVVTRMVIVEVVVRDSEDNPVRDLRDQDLQVSERIGDSKEIPEKIASFRPVTEPLDRSADRKGIVLGWLHKSFCGLTGAYELSYYLSPESRKYGLHRISVTTSRPNLILYFRPGYKIEADKPADVSAAELAEGQTNSRLKDQQVVEAEHEKHPELELATIACYDTLNTTNFSLQVQKLDSKNGMTLQFLVPGSYFASLPASAYRHPTQMDLSVCIFESGGQPSRHFEGSVQAGRSPDDYRLLNGRGFTQNVTVEATAMSEFSARLVVRDRATGAMGSGEILLGSLGNDHFPAPIPEGLTNSLFGKTTQDTPLAMCGDVYQLEPWTLKLPRFSEIDATAPIYATSLGVYDRFFTVGIPGVTSRTEWFGVNYQGVFGVDKAGKYEFDLLSDDGAKVYIDDKLTVSDDTLHSAEGSRGRVRLDAGAHNIRVSYFQGPRTEVALVLLVKPPGKGWRLFDARDFPDPADSAGQRKKLPLP